MAQICLHFGAGALGRGLVLPLLAKSGTDVCIADINVDVVDRISAEGGYPIAIFKDGNREDVFVPVAKAFALGRDDKGLNSYLREADFITTSVQVGNLQAVVNRLAGVWEHGRQARTVVGCENLRKVGGHLRTLFEAESPALSEHVFTPDCVVDRICSASPSDLLIETEPYTEWVVEAPDELALKGPSLSADVDRLFFRKRYLVNTLADAVSFIGMRKGHAFLHQAVTDPQILSSVAPLMALLRSHLIRAFQFAERELVQYQELSIQRLSNTSISRRIETVARDPWRKFGPAERFMEPVLAEYNSGAEVSEALSTMRTIIASVDGNPASAIGNMRQAWGEMASSPLFADLTD